MVTTGGKSLIFFLSFSLTHTYTYEPDSSIVLIYERSTEPFFVIIER